MGLPMIVSPPRRTSRRVPDNPQAALDYEIAQDKAAALGRLGRRLEAALAALGEFDRAPEPAAATGLETRAARRALAADAGVALWHFIVQRESLGLRDSARVMRDYGVPADVRMRMSAFPVDW
jgi:hypothetical protein